MNYVKLIFGQEFQWPKILSFFLQTKAVFNALILHVEENTKAINNN